MRVKFTLDTPTVLHLHRSYNDLIGSLPPSWQTTWTHFAGAVDRSESHSNLYMIEWLMVGPEFESYLLTPDAVIFPSTTLSIPSAGNNISIKSSHNSISGAI